MCRRFLAAAVALSGLVSPARAQFGTEPPIPSTVALPAFFSIASSGNLGEDGGFTSGLGTAGTNPGWTLFRYGNVDGGGHFRITATSLSPASVYYWTAKPDQPTTSASPLGFDPAVASQWKIIAPASGTTAQLQITVSDTGGLTFLPLDNTANLVAYNVRLNEVLDFYADRWIDPNTNAPILPTVGKFDFTFADFDGGRYRSINLVYTPVPEPSAILAIAVAAVVVFRVARRWRVQRV